MADKKVLVEFKSNIAELETMIAQYKELEEKIKNFELKVEVIIPAPISAP